MKKNIKISLVCGLLFILLIVLLKTVDVAPIGPNETSVGLSSLNGMFHDLLPYNSLFYTISKLLGIIAIGCAALMAVLGLMQLSQRRRIAKMDKEFLALAGLYAMVIVLYVAFEFIVINYRPVIMPGDTAPEPSFPSTHTMLAVTVMGSIVLMAKHFITDLKARKTVVTVSYLIMILVILTRFLSGVHWFTDILGGILLSLVLLGIFSGTVPETKTRRVRKPAEEEE